MSRLGAQREHGHEHKDIGPLLRDYGADHVPTPPHQRWMKMRCPFHDDGNASAQTDGVGFRCFTCDLFYPAPLSMLVEREGLNLDDAHDRYHGLVGGSDSSLPGSGQLGWSVPGQPRNRPSSRNSRQARGRH